ncbi:MAG: response regulator [Elusimicrobia bacterium]|nr:response regulator [Elusimicrobiota bacterium]
MAEDDEDDYFLVASAFREAGLDNPLHRAEDGEALMDFLLRRGRHAGAPRLPPILLLLDLRMPKKSGWEALREIKSDARLRRIPVAVLTSSNAEEDVARAYDLGCNTFIKKPSGLEGYAALAQAVKTYWLKVAEIPNMEPLPAPGGDSGPPGGR